MSLQRHIDQVAKGKKPTLQGTRNRVQTVIAGRHMKQLFPAKVIMGKDQIPRLRWAFAEKEWKKLHRTLLGKTILFTYWRKTRLDLPYAAAFATMLTSFVG